MKQFLIRITLRCMGGYENEFTKIFEGYTLDEVCNNLEEEYNCKGVCEYEVIKQIYGEEAYYVEINKL